MTDQMLDRPAGRERDGRVLAVLDDAGADDLTLRYAALVAAVDDRDLAVLVLRRKMGFTLDPALLVARRSGVVRVSAVLGPGMARALDIAEITVGRDLARRPAAVWPRLLEVARRGEAVTVVVPASLGRPAPRTLRISNLHVVSVGHRPATGRHDEVQP